MLSLVLPPPRMPPRAQPTGRALSALFHVGVAALLMAVWSRPEPAASPAGKTTHQPLQLPRLVFLQSPAPGGGGGGGGNRQRTPPSRAQAVGRDRITVPVRKRSAPSERMEDVAPARQEVLLEAKPLSAGTLFAAGLPDAPPSLPFSLGPGVGGGVGDGTGSGIGPGTGPGIGAGTGGGFGGGAYRVGGGVTPPTLLSQVRPKYTGEAMRLRTQGTVTLEVVVSREGIPVAMRVTRSLDPGGLDDEAMAAVRQWRFTPGRIGSTPVDVLVTVFVDFTIR